MGIEQRDAARALFPPLDALDAVGPLATPDVLIDAAAFIRGYMKAFPSVQLALRMARGFATYLRRLFPGPRRFHFLLEGAVPTVKAHVRAHRSTSHAADLRRKGVDLDAASADAALPAAIRDAAGVPGDAPVRAVLAQYARRAPDEVAAGAAGAPEAIQRDLVHRIMPELERICLAAALAMTGDATAQIADGDDTLPPEGEAKALPYARRLGRPCLFVGNDTDIFVIALLQVPRFADHPDVYYYDIARRRVQKGAPHIIDLVACVRALPRPGVAPRDIALALLLCGNDYVPAPDDKHMTLCRLSAKRARNDDTYWAAYQLVAATRGDAEALTDLVATCFDAKVAYTRFDAKVAYTRADVGAYVRRAMVAADYYNADSLADVPPDAAWLAHGWETMTRPRVIAADN